jgi:hypothetical protein
MQTVHEKCHKIREYWFTLQQAMRDHEPCVYPVIIRDKKGLLKPETVDVIKFDLTADDCKIFCKRDEDWIPLYRWRDEDLVRCVPYAWKLLESFSQRCEELQAKVDDALLTMRLFVGKSDDRTDDSAEPASGSVWGDQPVEEASEIVNSLGVVGLEQAEVAEEAPIQGPEAEVQGPAASEGDKPDKSFFVRWFEHRGYHGEVFREMSTDFGNGEKDFYTGYFIADGKKIKFVGNSEELAESDFRREVDAYIDFKKNDDSAFVKRLNHRGKGANLRKSLNGSYFFGEVEAPEFHGKIVFDGYTKVEAEECFRERVDNYLDSRTAPIASPPVLDDKSIEEQNELERKYWERQV